MRSIKKIQEYLKTLDYLISISNKIGKNKNNNYYIVYSPFVYNTIEGCKETKKLYKDILLKKLNINENEYKKIMGLSTKNFEPEIDFFIKLNKGLPNYKNFNQNWINLMYYSSIHMQYKNYTGKKHVFFIKNISKINCNYLNVNNIVMPLYLLEEEVKEYIKNNNGKITIEQIKQNNIFLMLLSDYKDIIENIRKKEYKYNINKINVNLQIIEKSCGINKEKLFELNFQELINKNYENINK